jgi:hypothetical protein
MDGICPLFLTAALIDARRQVAIGGGPDRAPGPYSSFSRMVRLGLYPGDWGGDVAEDTTGFGER